MWFRNELSSLTEVSLPRYVGRDIFVCCLRPRVYVTSPETRLYCCLAADWPKHARAPVEDNGSFAAWSSRSLDSCGDEGRNGRALCYFVSLELYIEWEETCSGIADVEVKVQDKETRNSLTFRPLMSTIVWRTAPLTSKVAFYIFIQQI